MLASNSGGYTRFRNDGTLGRNDEAIALLERASAIAPERFAYRANLAAVLGRAGRPRQALPHLEAALRLRPDSPEAHNNLGAALEQLNRLAEAADHFRRAIVLRRAYPEAWYNLGNVLRKAGRLAAAVSGYEEAVRLQPDYFNALAHVPPLLTELGDAAGAIACCRRITALRPADPAPRSAMLYTLHYSPECDAQSLAREHCEWGRRFCDPLRQRITPHENDRDSDRRLRIGYVSPSGADSQGLPAGRRGGRGPHVSELFGVGVGRPRPDHDKPVVHGLRGHHRERLVHVGRVPLGSRHLGHHSEQPLRPAVGQPHVHYTGHLFADRYGHAIGRVGPDGPFN